MIYIILTILSVYLLYYKNNHIGYLLIIFILFIGAFRDSTIGTDTGFDVWYYKNFMITTFNPDTWNKFTPFEPGFNIFIAFYKQFISSNYYSFYSTIYIITYIFLFIAVKKINVSPSLFFPFFWLIGGVSLTFNIMRQSLAFSILLYFTMLYYKKELGLIIYLIVTCLVGFLIHKSCFIFLFFPIINYKPILSYFTTNRLFIILLISIGIALLGSSYIERFILSLNSLFGERADHYIEVVEKYGIKDNITSGILGPSLYTSCIILISNNKRSTLATIAILGLCFTIISGPYLGAIARLFINLTLFASLYLATIWWDKSEKDKMFFYNVIKICILLYYLISLNGSVFNNPELNPYENYLF